MTDVADIENVKYGETALNAKYQSILKTVVGKYDETNN